MQVTRVKRKIFVFAALAALARKEKLAYASSGVGTTTHLSMERIKIATGVDITHVPYQPAQAVTAAVSGQTQISSTSMPPAVPQIKERLAQNGLTHKRNSPAEFAAFVREEIPKWAKAVKDSGAKAD